MAGFVTNVTLVYFRKFAFRFKMYVVVIHFPFIITERLKLAELNLHIFLHNIEIPCKQLLYAEWGNSISFPKFK